MYVLTTRLQSYEVPTSPHLHVCSNTRVVCQMSPSLPLQQHTKLLLPWAREYVDPTYPL